MPDVQTALAALGVVGLDLKEEDAYKFQGPDTYGDELVVMAETAAYFDVSYKVGRTF